MPTRAKKSCNELTTETDSDEAQLLELETKLKDLKTQLQLKNASLEEEKGKLVATTEANTKLTEKLNIKEKSYQELLTKSNTAEAELLEVKTTIENVETQLKERNLSLQEEKEKLVTMTEVNTKLITNMGVKENSYQELLTNHNTINAELLTAKKDLQLAAETINEMDN